MAAKPFVKKAKIGHHPADIAKLDIHDWYGNLIARLKAPATDKMLGAAMIMKLKDMFTLTDKEIEELYDMFQRNEMEEQKKLLNSEPPIKWPRNPDGSLK